MGDLERERDSLLPLVHLISHIEGMMAKPEWKNSQTDPFLNITIYIKAIIQFAHEVVNGLLRDDVASD